MAENTSKTWKLDDISSLTVLEAAELAKMLEEKWGLSAAVAVAPGPTGRAAAALVEAQTEFTVVLATAGDGKTEVIKEVRAITGLGLKEAKDLVERAPTVVKERITQIEASSETAQLASAGAQALLVSIIPSNATAGAMPDSGPRRHPMTDFRQEAESIGVPVAPESNRREAAAIVLKIAENSRDLFPDQAAVRTFLFDHPIDRSGKTAVDLVQERGAAALLIKLDQMRFGANG